MICAKCKYENETGAAYCGKCGRFLMGGAISADKAELTSAPFPDGLKNRKFLAIGGIAVTALVIAVSVIAINLSSDVKGVGPNGTTLDNRGFNALFSEAETDVDNGRYLEAADKFQYIPEKHGKYSEAQAGITEAHNLYIAGVSAQAEKLAADGQFAEALTKTQEGLEAMPSNEKLKNTADTINEQYLQSFITASDQSASVGDFDTALKNVENGLAVFTGAPVLAQKREALLMDYKSSLIERARALRAGGQFSEAEEILNTAHLNIFAGDYDIPAQVALTRAEDFINRASKATPEAGLPYLRDAVGELRVAISIRVSSGLEGNEELESLLSDAEARYRDAFTTSWNSYIAAADFPAALNITDSALLLFADDASFMAYRADTFNRYDETTLAAEETTDDGENAFSSDGFIKLSALNWIDGTESKTGMRFYSYVKDNQGNEYSDGFGGIKDYGDCWQSYELDGNYARISGKVVLNYDYRTWTDRGVVFEIYADDKKVYTSPDIREGVEPIDFSVDISGVDTLRLTTVGGLMIRVVDCVLAYSTAEDSQEYSAVTFYENADGTGWEVSYPAANYEAFVVEDMGFPNDRLSGVRINADGVSVTLYNNHRFDGENITLTGKGLYNLVNYNLNDKVSSYKIETVADLQNNPNTIIISGETVLSASAAELSTELGILLEGFDTEYPNIGYWKSGAKAVWPITVEKPGRYKVLATYSKEGKSFDATVITVGNKTISRELLGTGQWSTYTEDFEIGEIELADGDVSITMSAPADMNTTYLCNLRWIKLAPVS
jgi:tetratricopeptide (TPR) repeat protein